MTTANEHRQEKKKVIAIWLWKHDYNDYLRKANKVGLPLGSLARLLLKSYCEGKIDLKL